MNRVCLAEDSEKKGGRGPINCLLVPVSPCSWYGTSICANLKVDANDGEQSVMQWGAECGIMLIYVTAGENYEVLVYIE